METWIESLYYDLEHGEWGTEPVIGAAWDLSHLADWGLIDGIDLDRRLDAIVNRDCESIEEKTRVAVC